MSGTTSRSKIRKRLILAITAAAAVLIAAGSAIGAQAAEPKATNAATSTRYVTVTLFAATDLIQIKVNGTDYWVDGSWGSEPITVPAGRVTLSTPSRTPDGLKFVRWSDGSTNPNHTMTVTSDTGIQAYYRR